MRQPLDLLARLGEALRGLAELPLTLQRTVEETNALIADSRVHLDQLRLQVDRMVGQLERMTAIADRLVDATAPMAGMAEEARRQMALTSAQLAATNQTLEQIVRLAEPLDRMSKRLVGGLLRVTRRRVAGAVETDDPADE